MTTIEITSKPTVFLGESLPKIAVRLTFQDSQRPHSPLITISTYFANAQSGIDRWTVQNNISTQDNDVIEPIRALLLTVSLLEDFRFVKNFYRSTLGENADADDLADRLKVRVAEIANSFGAKLYIANRTTTESFAEKASLNLNDESQQEMKVVTFTILKNVDIPESGTLFNLPRPTDSDSSQPVNKKRRVG